ncbi:MAG TPA: DUF2130 domain-containing protein [Terriglobia bacterium]|nr:DUF2130 domain-containing protein [Terriglobia bacterium]HZU43080.1 DUF2130 domain-containing protein [Terriglobales bacterium]
MPTTTEPTIICPKCKTEIRLSESLAAPLIESAKRQYDAQLAKKEEEVAKREGALREERAALDKARESIDVVVAEKLAAERRRIAEEEAKKAQRALSTELEQKAAEIADLEHLLKERDAKLSEAQKAQVELIRKQRELEDARRELDLTVEKRVQESVESVRLKARGEAEEALKLKVAEKEQTIASMQRQIEVLKQKAEQGSQQLQGEVQELELEALLTARYPQDTILPVPKGEQGGDIIQCVNGPLGQPCGKILWEAKRTKHWSDGWLSKLREDQRVASADIAVIVSHALPKDVDTFGLIDGVWVSAVRCVIPVSVAIRQALVDIAAVRNTQVGQQTKMAMVYQYLTSQRFRHRIEAIVEKFADMQTDLERERKAMTRLWAKREEQIRGVVEATAGLYGDLQGIAGKTLREIEGLNVNMLGDGSEHGSDRGGKEHE